MKLKKKMLNIIIVICTILTLAVPSRADLVELTENGLGLGTGNLGPSLVVNDFIEISALTQILYSNEAQKDSFDNSLAGSIYLDGNKGLGVQRLDGGGSKAISGNGPDQDEGLVFDFTDILATSVLIGLNKYKPCNDDPIIRMLLSGGSYLSFSQEHQNWANAVTSQGRDKIEVNMGLLLEGQSISPNMQTDKLYIKNVSGHMYVNSVGYQAIPEPATVCILGLGSMLLFSQRKKFA